MRIPSGRTFPRQLLLLLLLPLRHRRRLLLTTVMTMRLRHSTLHLLQLLPHLHRWSRLPSCKKKKKKSRRQLLPPLLLLHLRQLLENQVHQLQAHSAAVDCHLRAAVRRHRLLVQWAWQTCVSA